MSGSQYRRPAGSPERDKFRREFAAARFLAGISVSQIAKDLNLSSQTLYQYINLGGGSWKVQEYINRFIDKSFNDAGWRRAGG